MMYPEDTIKRKLFKKYYNLINIFNRNKIKKLSLYQPYNYKIKLELGKKPL